MSAAPRIQLGLHGFRAGGTSNRPHGLWQAGWADSGERSLVWGRAQCRVPGAAAGLRDVSAKTSRTAWLSPQPFISLGRPLSLGGRRPPSHRAHGGEISSLVFAPFMRTPALWNRDPPFRPHRPHLQIQSHWGRGFTSEVGGHTIQPTTLRHRARAREAGGPAPLPWWWGFLQGSPELLLTSLPRCPQVQPAQFCQLSPSKPRLLSCTAPRAVLASEAGPDSGGSPEPGLCASRWRT